MDVFDACSQIRADAGPKGKKCPGGYSIPANKQCGGRGRARGKGRLRTLGPGLSVGGAVAGGVLGVGLGAATAVNAIARGEEKKRGGGSEADQKLAKMKKLYKAATGRDYVPDLDKGMDREVVGERSEFWDKWASGGGGSAPGSGSKASQEAAEKGGKALDEWVSADEPLKSNKSSRAGKEKGKGRKDSARRVFAAVVQNGRG